MIENLKPIIQFSNDSAQIFGVKPEAIRRMIDRNYDELKTIGAVFKTKGRGRVVNPDKFLKWYLDV